MTLTQLASHYISFNLLILFGTIFSYLLFFFNRKIKLTKAKQELRFNYTLISFIILVSAVQFLLPKKEFFQPPVKVWSASSSKGFAADFSADLSRGYLSLDFVSHKPVIDTTVLNICLWAIALVVIAFGLYRLIRDLSALSRITRLSFLIRKFRSLKIYSSDLVNVPFSFWTPGNHVVVIPNGMLGNTEDLKTAILHEIQHHRQRDTYWVHLLWLVKILCCWNPFIYLWNRLYLEIQEFACDEALVDRSKVSSKAYASCLVRVAQTAVSQERSFVCATGLTFMADRHTLKRRIQTMLSNKRIKLNRYAAIFISVLILAGLTCVAFASQGLIQDRRVTLKEAKVMLASLKGDDGFSVVVNDLVLKQLNRFIGTPEGRDFMRKSLARMENYRPLIEKKLNEYSLPQEFLAVPLIESGYQNSDESPTGMHSAGLWQFIPSTARHYGLRVDENVDERLNVDILTDAAMRYLTANKVRFKSAELSILAFNAGEDQVQRGIDKTGSRDVWTLIRSGYEGDADYIPKLMAAILIMKNPSVVQ